MTTASLQLKLNAKMGTLMTRMKQMQTDFYPDLVFFENYGSVIEKIESASGNRNYPNAIRIHSSAYIRQIRVISVPISRNVF